MTSPSGVLAENRDPLITLVGDICSRELAVLGPDDDVEYATRLVRERAVRRLPVIADGTPVGVVPVGDLAPGRRNPADPTVPDGIKPG